MADKRISELTNITGSAIADTDEFVVVDASASETKAITASELRTAIGNGDFTVTGNLTVQGTTITVDSAAAQNIVLGDNDKMTFGAGSDLEIYHSGIHSYIQDNGTGDLFIRASDNLTLQQGDGSGGWQNAVRTTDNADVALYYQGNEKLTTTSTGIAVTGDATFADNGKAIFGAGSDLQIYHDGANSYIQDTGTGALGLFGSTFVGLYETGSGDKMVIANGGSDVELYYDNALKLATTSTGVDVTGTVTADGLTVEESISSVIASASGTVGRFINNANSSDAAIVDIVGGNTSVTSGEAISALYLSDANANGRGRVQYNHQNDNLQLYSAAVPRLNIANNGDISFYEDTGTTPKFFWDASAERLGIGLTDPNYDLSVGGSSGSHYIQVRSDDSTSTLGLLFADSAAGNKGAIFYDQSAEEMYFRANNSERMRIDSSGNLLVGDTSATFNDTAKTVIRPSSDNWTIKPSVVHSFNRTGSDGDILEFYRTASTKVGSIASAPSAIIFGSGDVNLKFLTSSPAIYPRKANDATSDGYADLGLSSNRFNDIYATNALIQTSDRNEKQDIAELDEAERRVAVAAKGLLRKFRWKDAVAEKGDAARIHFGIIAQDLQAAFEAEGLDAGDYAMFIHSTWTDEETGEERSRMGVRYPELLAFIIAAI